MAGTMTPLGNLNQTYPHTIIKMGPWSERSIENMITSSNGNIFRVTGLLCWEFTGHQGIPLTKASNAEVDVFFDLHLNRQSWGWWFETPSLPFWRHRNEYNITMVIIYMLACVALAIPKNNNSCAVSKLQMSMKRSLYVLTLFGMFTT